MRQPPPLLFLLSSFFTYCSIPTPGTALPQGQLPAVTQDNGQVTINPNPTTASDNQPAENIPIRATIYSGVPGPSHCRGHAVLLLDLPPPPLSPAGTLITTTPRCYDIPPSSSSSIGLGGCGIFSGSKSSGCEARLFAEPNCAGYLNTVVFMPEQRAVGGQWRSVEVRCGVSPPDEEALGTPPLVGIMGEGMKVKENKKPGRRWVG